ncbi:hypothetical protein Goshw_021505 [Gossypium schwendimanii]|uniref:Uncharacterized protein n=1 Tax=Gossypium schwendimanii TaxID=34291 RepID=A0A7J9MQ20_GOSSC|nr:hypothetical protein [Gossypium schwendimanii]
MEFNSKRRGFFKGKLTPFYRAVKGVPTRQYSSKVKPNQGSSTSASISFRVHQDYMISQPKQISYIVPGDKNRENLSQIDNFFGVTGDESVDIKAATYISSVQERPCRGDTAVFEYQGYDDEWRNGQRNRKKENWNFVKILPSEIVGSKPQCLKLWPLRKGHFGVSASR